MDATIQQSGTKVLRPEVLRVIDKPGDRSRIAASMNLGEQVIKKYIKNNDPKLTQYSPLQVIKQIMGSLDTDELLMNQTEYEKLKAAES